MRKFTQREKEKMQNEYDLRLAELDEIHRKSIASLNSAFAMRSRRFNIGEKIEDNVGQKIIIEQIYWGKLGINKYPVAIYIGPLLKADGTIRKDGKQESIFDPQATLL